MLPWRNFSTAYAFPASLSPCLSLFCSVGLTTSPRYMRPILAYLLAFTISERSIAILHCRFWILAMVVTLLIHSIQCAPPWFTPYFYFPPEYRCHKTLSLAIRPHFLLRLSRTSKSVFVLPGSISLTINEALGSKTFSNCLRTLCPNCFILSSPCTSSVPVAQ